MWEWGEKFGRPTKIAAHWEDLLEIKILHPPSKYEDGSSFSHSTGVALTHPAGPYFLGQLITIHDDPQTKLLPDDNVHWFGQLALKSSQISQGR